MGGILTGHRILIVEDEVLLAMDLKMILEDEGCEVLGTIPTVEGALKVLLEQHPDAVTLDMNLNGTSSAPIAAVLREMGIPFLIVSGYSEKATEDLWSKDVPRVNKPYNTDDLFRKLGEVLA